MNEWIDGWKIMIFLQAKWLKTMLIESLHLRGENVSYFSFFVAVILTYNNMYFGETKRKIGLDQILCVDLLVKLEHIIFLTVVFR